MYEKRMVTVVCYKLKEPVVYNKGTVYESKCDHFLAYQTYETLEEAKKICEILNKTKPATLWNGEPIDWTQVEKFYADRQEVLY